MHLTFTNLLAETTFGLNFREQNIASKQMKKKYQVDNNLNLQDC